MRHLSCLLSRRTSATALCCLAAFTASAASTNSPAEQLLKSARPLVIAHRGYSAIAPENTLPSFERALAAGADLVELDYHHSEDGALVVPLLIAPRTPPIAGAARA
jgi:glycerophosphoryl diester phosphodiesterase